MKHRQVGLGKVGVLNPDGHAIGIDLGAQAVRAAVLAPGMLDGRPSVTMHGAGEVELPPGAVVNGVVSDAGSVTRALKQLWETHKLQCRSVILGITNQQVVVRELTLPNLAPEQLALALPFQARELLPFPAEQALLDFAPLGEPTEATDTITGLIVGVPREPVVAAVNAVEGAGLTVARVDLSSFALLRAIAAENRAVEAVVDVGSQITHIVVHNGGIPRVVRAVTRGGEEVTELIVSKCGMNRDEADAAKREIGLTGSDQRVADIVAQGVRPLLAELRSSVQYFLAGSSGAQIDRVSLTGRGALLPGFAEVLSEQLGVPVEVVPATQHIRNRWHSGQQPNDQQQTELPTTAVAIGLAMGAAA